MLAYIPKPLVGLEMMNKNEELHLDGVELLDIIANKDKNIEAATKAFHYFVSIFENKIKKQVEIIASKYGYDENIAFEAITCAFNKVWLYPTFDMNKSHCKNKENAIVIWLIRIAVSQMFQFAKKGICAQIEPEEDLSIIENSEGFVDFHIADLEPEQKIQYVMALEQKLSCLGEKHKIIYLTYKAYQVSGKKLPRKLLEKLRKRLGLTQTTIRVYKKEACETIGDLSLLRS